MKVDVLIGGKRVPHAGNICMDQTMVNVTGMDVKVGDEVVLIGRQGSEHITPEEIAAARNTINYEVPIMFLRRVPRVYNSYGPETQIFRCSGERRRRSFVPSATLSAVCGFGRPLFS